MASVQATWPVSETGITKDAAARAESMLRIIRRYCVVAVVSGLYLFPFMRTLSGVRDEGIYLYAAQVVAQGAIPGRDFVQENAPGAYYWLSWFFRAFGISFLTARTLLLFTGVATVLVVFYLARRMGSRGLASAAFVLITSVPLMPINSPHYDSNLFALLAFAFFLTGLDFISREDSLPWFRYWPFVIAGVFTGWVSCILQQKGFIFLFAFAGTTLVLYRARAIRPSLAMAVSYGSVLIAQIVPYVIWGALPDLIFSAVKMPLMTYQGINRAPYGYPLWTVWFPSLYSQFRLSTPAWFAVPLLIESSLPFIFILLLPLLVAVAGFKWRKMAAGKELLPYFIAAYAMFVSELHRQDLFHLRNGSVLLAIVFFIMCERFGSRPFKVAALSVTLGTLLIGTTTVNAALQAHETIVSRRGTLYSAIKYPMLNELIARTHPGDYAFVYPYSPIYYFLADVRNPTRFNVIVDQRRENPMIAEAIRDLDSKRPRYVVMDTTMIGDGMRTMFPGYPTPPPQDRAIDCYIADHYHRVLAENGVDLLERNGS